MIELFLEFAFVPCPTSVAFPLAAPARPPRPRPPPPRSVLVLVTTSTRYLEVVVAVILTADYV